MILSQLTLTNFRSYSERVFSFSSGINLVVGPNTSGKTNLVEAIYLLSTGKPLWALLESEMVRWGENWARVEGQITIDRTDGSTDNADLGVDLSVSGEIEGGDKMELEVFIERNSNNHTRKQFKLNNVKKSLGEFQGNLRVVAFSPESLRLILGRPSRRRSYLDRVLSSLDSSYFRILEEYRKVLKNRNKLLWQIREVGISKARLEFWDGQLFDLGGKIYEAREEFIGELNQRLSGSALEISLSYQPSVLDRRRYTERLPQEIEKAATLWGPHRDDFRFFRINSNYDRVGTDGGKDLAVFGSRGEQREAVFALCLAELEVVSERVGARPILLLDDIFSELDEAHRKRVLEVLPRQQTIITSAEPELLNSGLVEKTKVIELG